MSASFLEAEPQPRTPCSRAQEVTVCVLPPLQPLFFPVDANCNGVFQPRSSSPSSLLDTAISEEARQGPGLEEEQEAREPLPGSTGRRHTLAEVSTHFSPLAPPCKWSRGYGGVGVKAMRAASRNSACPSHP